MSTAQVALIISAAAGLVALFGAINSARALRWQRARDAERSEVRAHIEIEHEVGNIPDVADRLSERVEPVPPIYRLHLAIVNDSEERVIFVQELAVWAFGLGVGVQQPKPPDVRLEPRERHVRVIPLDERDVRNLRNGFTATATLTTGDVIAKPSWRPRWWSTSNG